MATHPLTPTEIAVIRYIISHGSIDPLATQSFVAAQIASAQTSNTQPYPTISPVPAISSGVLKIYRQERIMMVPVDTEGEVSADDLDTISPLQAGDTPNNGDQIILYQTVLARVINVTNAGNISLTGGSAVIGGEGHYLWLKWDTVAGKWIEVSRYPQGASSTYESETVYASSGAITVDPTKNYVHVIGELSAETLATQVETITAAAGASGASTVYVDEGDGEKVIGTTSYTIATTPAAHATAIAAAITGGTTGYTAAAVGAIVTITARPTTGATANTYFIRYKNEGGVTSTPGTATLMAGGVDGTEQDDTIDTIYGGAPGTVLIIRNDMSSNILKFIASATIATAFSLNAGAQLFLIQDSASKWKPMSVAIPEDISFLAEDLKDPGGAYNGMPVSAGTVQANNWNRPIALTSGATIGRVGRVVAPTKFIPGSTVYAKVRYNASTPNAGNVYLHFGYLPVQVGDDPSVTTGTFQNITEAMPGTADTQQEFSISFVPSASTLLGNEYFNFILFREAGNAADTYADNFEWIDITFTLEVNP